MINEMSQNRSNNRFDFEIFYLISLKLWIRYKNKSHKYILCDDNCNLNLKICSQEAYLQEILSIKLKNIRRKKNLGIFLYKKNNNFFNRNITLISVKKEEKIYKNYSFKKEEDVLK
ncbi:hypothetical protein NSA27_08185 [Clostridium tepidum]|uniref:hypothetical protein n=1 Tax=Clostridium tepidum TaxID=1962263 RepID=UPI001FA8291B|nr:hypothetical protein [Clostridium tepidum]MCR1934668.1 hypothetical protein [Clostridium tepidum]MDU6877701.1 hypothetical protein [Clostridium botulinum]